MSNESVNYETLVNTSTSNTFKVIADDRANYFKGGIRFWLGAKGKPDTCKAKPYVGVIYFRFRLENLGTDTEKVAQSIEKALKKAYPKVKWTGGSSAHGSIAGGISTGTSPFDAEAIIERMDKLGVGGDLYDAFKHLFPSMNFYHNRADFQAFFMEEVKALFGKVESPDETLGVEISISGLVKSVEAQPIEIKEMTKIMAAALKESEPLYL